MLRTDRFASAAQRVRAASVLLEVGEFLSSKARKTGLFREPETDPVASSALSGAICKQRGVKPGVPDVLVWYRRKPITIELKSRHGQCSRPQRLAREALLRAGAQWWVCRSANAAMWALAQSGVPFRTIVHDDSALERWQQPLEGPGKSEMVDSEDQATTIKLIFDDNQ